MEIQKKEHESSGMSPDLNDSVYDFFKTVYFSLAVANARPCQHKCLGQVSGNGFQFPHKSSQVESKRVWFGSRVVSKHPVVIESIQQLRKMLCTLAQS